MKIINQKHKSHQDQWQCFSSWVSKSRSSDSDTDLNQQDLLSAWDADMFMHDLFGTTNVLPFLEDARGKKKMKNLPFSAQLCHINRVIIDWINKKKAATKSCKSSKNHTLQKSEAPQIFAVADYIFASSAPLKNTAWLWIMGNSCRRQKSPDFAWLRALSLKGTNKDVGGGGAVASNLQGDHSGCF